jgi:hypothetical protein
MQKASGVLMEAPIGDVVVLELGDISGDNAVEEGDGAVEGAGDCNMEDQGALDTLVLGEIATSLPEWALPTIPVEHGALDAMLVGQKAV